MKTFIFVVHRRHHYSFWKCLFLPRKARVRRLLIWSPSTYPLIPPIPGAKKALPCHHPTHSHQVFLFLPLNPRCSNHRTLPRLSGLTTSDTLCIPNRLYKSTLCFLSFNDTQHIHLTIIPLQAEVCKLIDGCSLELCSATPSVASAGICHRNEVNSIAWLYRDGLAMR